MGKKLSRAIIRSSGCRARRETTGGGLLAPLKRRGDLWMAINRCLHSRQLKSPASGTSSIREGCPIAECSPRCSFARGLASRARTRWMRLTCRQVEGRRHRGFVCCWCSLPIPRHADHINYIPGTRRRGWVVFLAAEKRSFDPSARPENRANYFGGH